MSSWSVRLNARTERDYESGGTGVSSEQFAREVYEKLVERVRKRGGVVELLCDGQVVAKFEVKEGEKES